MAYKQLDIDGKKYFTIYKLTELEVGMEIFLFFKRNKKLVKTKLIAIPDNVTSFLELDIDAKFVFQSPTKTFEITKRFHSASSFTYPTSIPNTNNQYTEVLFLTSEARKSRARKLTDHQQSVLDAMKEGVPYIASELNSRVTVMEKLLYLGLVREYEYSYHQNPKLGSFRKFIKN